MFFTIFLVLKLAGLVTWSWWVVFLPLVIEFVLIFMIRLFTTSEGP